MERHRRSGHLVSTRARSHSVARTAVHTFVAVVAKATHIFCGRVSRARAARFVACAARVYIVSLSRHFCRHRGFGSMALEARGVRVGSRRHGESLATLRRLMTRRTVRLRDVFGVIEFCPERCEDRELFHRSGRAVGVAN